MSRFAPGALLLGCFLAAASCSTATAADGVASSDAKPLEYLLNLGPIGALVWGAYKLGSGVKLVVVVELSEHDRDLFKSARLRVA